MTSEQPAAGAPQDTSGPHEVVLRRSPKYSTFMALGAAVGIVVALVLTVSQSVDADYTFGQVLGFLLLVCVVLGLFAGGMVAIVLDRIVSRHAHTVLVQRVVARREEGDGSDPAVVPADASASVAETPAAQSPVAGPATTTEIPEAGSAPTSSGERMSDIATPVSRTEVRR